MEIVTLGTGTLVPRAHTASAGVLVVEGEHRLPIDLGRNVLSRVVEAGVDPLELDQWFFTHLHPDHCAELVSLLFGLNYGVRPVRTRPMRLFGPAGLERLVKALEDAWTWLVPTYVLEVHEIEEGPVQVPNPDLGFELNAVRLVHGNTANLGYRVRSPRSGATIAFTGDTGPCPALVELARGVDVLVAECASLDDQATDFHMAPTALGEAAREADVGHLVITHLYPETAPEAVLAGVRRQFTGPVSIARDGQRFVAPTV